MKHLTNDTDEAAVFALIDELNADPSFNGILVQLPLPPHIDALAVTEHVAAAKDVDGVHPHNMGRLVLREPSIHCCTAKAVMTLLQQTGVEPRGLHATVVGASNHVGRPVGLELLLVGCTVTTVHRFSRDTREHVAQADIVVSATGKAGLIGADWVKPGAIVIDVGIVAQADGRLRGDVRFEEVSEKAGWITPVPGGVGPMTRAALLQNTFAAAELTDLEPSAGEREGPAPRMKEPSAGERVGPAPRMKEPSAGERGGPAPRMKEPSAGEREGLAPRMKEPG